MSSRIITPVEVFEEQIAVEASDKTFLLMSMALDGLLDDQETARFERLLGESPALSNEWAICKCWDEQFHETPSVQPPTDFVASVEKRMVVADRRKQLWLGTLVGVVSVLLWGGILVGGASLFAFIVYNQAEWGTGLVQSFAFWSVALGNWYDAIATMSRTVLGTPQALGVVTAYVLMAMVILTTWMRLLQRSVRTAGATVSTV